MNKATFAYLLLLFALFLGAVKYSDNLQKPFISALNSIKTSYLATTQSISNGFEKHFYQAQTIEALKKELEDYNKKRLVLQSVAYELNELYKANDLNLSVNPQVELVRTISYQKLGDPNRLWLDVKDYNSSKIYGLVSKGKVAGIALDHNDKLLALLINDIKSAYAVSIGKVKAPGIAHGNNDENLVVSFIPTWYPLEIGDEVVTSGLDNIFFKGLKVGTIVAIDQAEGYQNATVKPYYNSSELNYFYMIKEVK